MYAFRRMCAQFQLAVNHILKHLEHAVLHLFIIMRLLDVFLQELQTFFLHFFLGTHKQHAFLMGTGNILVHIDTNKDAHLIDTIQERAHSKIARRTKESNDGIKVLYLRVVLKYPLKLIHQCVPTSVSKKVGRYRYICHIYAIDLRSERTICSDDNGS